MSALKYLGKVTLHMTVIVVAVYLATEYGGLFTKRESRKQVDIKKAILKQMEKTIATVCDSKSPNKCFVILDRAYLHYDTLIVERSLKVSETSEIRITSVELQTPKELTWKNFNTRQWNVNKLVVTNLYAKVMIAMGFVTEALKFDPDDWQNVLVIGMGGGAMCNFLNEVDFIKVNLTTVELDEFVVKVAKEWFGVTESDMHRVVIENGVTFVQEAVKRGEKYKSILLDACYNDNEPVVCPIPEFRKDEVIKNLARLLDDGGVLAMNILCLRDAIGTENELLATYKDYFETCFLLRFNFNQRLLVCTNKKNWSFEENEDHFLSNLWKVDDRFDFKIYDSIHN